MFEQISIIVIAAVILDLVIGEIDRITHPVVIIGNFIDWGEERLRQLAGSSLAEKAAGLILAVVTIGLTWSITYFLVMAAVKVNIILGLIIKVLLISITLSISGLAEAAKGIYQPLVNDDLDQARQKLDWIVGRDTDELAENEIVRATVETVAENTVDGILSPLFYAFLGGAPLAMAYKAVNTLDSMLGYKNERYRYFGWAPARIDDLANLVPARISGLLFPLAALLLGKNSLQSFKIVLRDARKHPSPNGGYSEAAVAGALGVRLGGLNYYHGEPSFREHLGDETRKLVAADIKAAIHLMYLTTGLFLISEILFVII
ncbi:adenosylcobinamide-phosphate synthase CbiB [Acetohalobium arabaticum]|uniref:Cobalamin biosynthesis protein CobD n=1 Tax=Acetohalobium arabaticum (strain ATCC 49924 / DSM 5501 / Z-7288) TaxID=574087 RepID=D9QVW8_ACEAZ|nr:adenosylcobinamide-phosphate synthase CbiB [Acetohalobium arabaticum]ADL12377.1 cobalamin biosynthesis protein CobD [Acetohalobium arabaticum DSM 5501]